MNNTKVLFTEPGRVDVRPAQETFDDLGPREILIQTRYSLISAATELACLGGGQSWFTYPGVPGYASVGEIMATGEQVQALAPGDMVYSMGGHKQYQVLDVSHPRSLCLKIPDDLPPTRAVFARMVCVAMTALRVSRIELGDYVAVLGLGLVGNFAAQLAKLQGGAVIGLDVNNSRAQLALECGIERAIAINPATFVDDAREMTQGQGASTLIEATGVPAALPMALPIAAAYGEVILLGTPRGEHQTNLTDILDYIHLHGHGSLTFKGAHEWRYPIKHNPFVKHSIERNARQAMDFINTGALKIAPLHTHTLSPYEAEAAYQGLQRNKDAYVGVLFDWSDVPPGL